MLTGVTSFGQPTNGTSYWSRARDSWEDKTLTTLVSLMLFHIYLYILESLMLYIYVVKNSPDFQPFNQIFVLYRPIPC